MEEVKSHTAKIMWVKNIIIAVLAIALIGLLASNFFMMHRGGYRGDMMQRGDARQGKVMNRERATAAPTEGDGGMQDNGVIEGGVTGSIGGTTTTR